MHDGERRVRMYLTVLEETLFCSPKDERFLLRYARQLFEDAGLIPQHLSVEALSSSLGQFCFDADIRGDRVRDKIFATHKDGSSSIMLYSLAWAVNSWWERSSHHTSPAFLHRVGARKIFVLTDAAVATLSLAIILSQIESEAILFIMLTLRAILSSPQEAACETLLSDLADMISYPSGAGLVVKMKSFEDVGEAIVDMASPLLAILLLHYGEGAALRCCILFEIMGCLLGICVVRQLVPGHGTDAENFRVQLAPTSISSVMEEFLSAWTNLNSSVKFADHAFQRAAIFREFHLCSRDAVYSLNDGLNRCRCLDIAGRSIRNADRRTHCQ